MKVMFNGMYTKIGGGGCKCRGNRAGKVAFVTRRSLTLPSNGRTISFHLGESYDVSEEDARFLLSYTYRNTDGAVFNAFTRLD